MSIYSKSFNLTNLGQVGWFINATVGLWKAFVTDRILQRWIGHAFIAVIIGISGFHSLTASAAAINLIPNPSVESANGTLPLSWNTYKEGTNTTTFTYKTNQGHTGSKSLYINMANRTSGYALWYFTDVAVKPNTRYTYSEFYRSNVATQIEMDMTSTSNTHSWISLASPAASATTWQQVTNSFTTPANVKQITIYHFIDKAGWLQTDDFSLVESTPLPPNSNTIPNPSVEIISGGKPQDWIFTIYGTNNGTASVLNTGHTGSHSIKIDIPATGYQNGSGAYWYYTPQPVIGGKHYLYTNWYQSNVDTEVDATITMSNGTEGWYYLGRIPASPTGWSQVKSEIDVPANATSITIYHILYSPGYLITDDFSFTPFTPTPLNRGLVSITFDDGYTTQYTKALPILNSLGLKATFYIISGALTDQPDYMTATQVKALYNQGMEIGSHSATHPDMTTLSDSDLTTEMTKSRDDLAAILGVGISVPDLAYPEGAYNLHTITVGQQYYQSQRNSDDGFNVKDFVKPYNRLKVKSVENGVTPTQVKAWIDQAKTQKTWLILLYHKIEDNPQPLPAGDLYTTRTSDFNQEMQYIKNSGVGVVTVDQAIKEIGP